MNLKELVLQFFLAPTSIFVDKWNEDKWKVSKLDTKPIYGQN